MRDVPADLFTVWATMMYPNDEQKRSEYVLVNHAARLDLHSTKIASLRATKPATYENLAKLARLPSHAEINEPAVEASGYGAKSRETFCCLS